MQVSGAESVLRRTVRPQNTERLRPAIALCPSRVPGPWQALCNTGKATAQHAILERLGWSTTVLMKPDIWKSRTEGLTWCWKSSVIQAPDIPSSTKALLIMPLPSRGRPLSASRACWLRFEGDWSRWLHKCSIFIGWWNSYGESTNICRGRLR